MKLRISDWAENSPRTSRKRIRNKPALISW